MSTRTAALRRRAEVGSKGDGQWRGIAVVVVSSLERGFQGENLSVDDWGLLGDWGLRQYLQFKQLGEQDWSSQELQWPPRPSARQKRMSCAQRLSPTMRSPLARRVALRPPARLQNRT